VSGRRIPSLTFGAALALCLILTGCSHDKDDGGAAAASTTTTTVVAAKRVASCGGLTAKDVNGLGVPGLKVVHLQNVSSIMQGPARGGQACSFDLRRTVAKTTERASLNVLVHPTGGTYFDAAIARAPEKQAIPGLGDTASYVGPTKDSPKASVIAKRGPLVVEAEVGNSTLLGEDQLIAITGLALERA